MIGLRTQSSSAEFWKRETPGHYHLRPMRVGDMSALHLGFSASRILKEDAAGKGNPLNDGLSVFRVSLEISVG